MWSIGRKGGEMFRFFSSSWRVFQLLFLHDEIFEHEQVHVGRKKASQRVLRGAHDGFTANVETCVHQHWAIGVFVEHFQ